MSLNLVGTVWHMFLLSVLLAIELVLLVCLLYVLCFWCFFSRGSLIFSSFSSNPSSCVLVLENQLVNTEWCLRVSSAQLDSLNCVRFI